MLRLSSEVIRTLITEGVYSGFKVEDTWIYPEKDAEGNPSRMTMIFSLTTDNESIPSRFFFVSVPISSNASFVLPEGFMDCHSVTYKHRPDGQCTFI